MAQIPAGENHTDQLAPRQRGAYYERLACRYLASRGLEFIAANVSLRGGELDLIMRQRQTVVFVEVRYRRSATYGGAVASITATKRRRLLTAAQQWLARHNGSFDTVDCRFDVIAFTGGEIAWFANAFTRDV